MATARDHLMNAQQCQPLDQVINLSD